MTVEKIGMQTRYWWVLLVVGIAMIFCGFAYWFWPFVGYVVASQMFGWLLVAVGVVQVVVSSSPGRNRGWAWWLIGGIIDIFIGFMLVRSVVLSEIVFPYFIAMVFLYWGVSAICNAVMQGGRRYWWLYLINGVLLIVFGFFFIEAGWVQDVEMSSLLTALAFIYWGFSLAMVSYDIKPERRKQ